jgi:SNF2 family DNA or RNA helicase
MTQLMNIMQIYFEYKAVKHLRLDGSTKDRGEMTTKFNDQNS